MAVRKPRAKKAPRHRKEVVVEFSQATLNKIFKIEDGNLVYKRSSLHKDSEGKYTLKYFAGQFWGNLNKDGIVVGLIGKKKYKKSTLISLMNKGE